MVHNLDLRNAAWRKSTYSNGDGGNCLEVADGYSGIVPVRDSKKPQGPSLLLRAEAWSRFITAVQHGSVTS